MRVRSWILTQSEIGGEYLLHFFVIRSRLSYVRYSMPCADFEVLQDEYSMNPGWRLRSPRQITEAFHFWGDIRCLSLESILLAGKCSSAPLVTFGRRNNWLEWNVSTILYRDRYHKQSWHWPEGNFTHPLCSVGFQRVTQPVQKTFFDIMFNKERVEI